MHFASVFLIVPCMGIGLRYFSNEIETDCIHSNVFERAINGSLSKNDLRVR